MPACNVLHANYVIKCFHVCTFDKIKEGIVENTNNHVCLLKVPSPLLCTMLLEPYGRVSRRAQDLAWKWTKYS